jgi:Domain of unknown function (DU1801)
MDDSDRVDAYLASVTGSRGEIMCTLDEMIVAAAPNFHRKMWDNTIGYGTYEYQYASGRTGEWPILGLANNQAYVSVYCCVTTDRGYLAEQRKDQLGKVSVGKSCVRFKKLEDVDLDAMRALLEDAVELSADINKVAR